MNRGPRRGRTSVDHVAKARGSWGVDAPEWVMALAEAAARTGVTAAAAAIGYSASTVSEVLSASYRGDIGRVEAMVRGRFLGASHPCPGLGRDIGTDRCRQEQRRPFSAASPAAIRLYAACRTCPHREVKS